METKMIRVPFSVELAKEITNGTKEGRIVTHDGRIVRIVCWDRKDVNYPIIALIDNVKNGEGFGFYTIDGKNGYYDDFFLMLEIPEYMTFKDGDVLLDKAGEPFIYNGVKKNGYGYVCGINYDGRLCICSTENSSWTSVVKGRASGEEKQKLIDALKQSTYPRAKECLKRFFNIDVEPKCNFSHSTR